MKHTPLKTLLPLLLGSALLIGCNDSDSLVADALAALPAADTQSTATPADSADSVTGDVSSLDLDALAQTVNALPIEALSAEEAASLQFMREEEKLAHDVYVLAYSKWSQRMFTNIAASESSHTAAVKLLLERYEIPDPATGIPGEFTNPALQAAYDVYTARVQLSLVDALLVGAEIEDLDIRDIEAEKAQIDNADILTVYDHLLAGSRNHMRAFIRQLTAKGMTYTPQFISQELFDAIIAEEV
ncbi:MAG: DUF2202 domain-containing protein [Thiotrichales bacterium]